MWVYLNKNILAFNTKAECYLVGNKGTTTHKNESRRYQCKTSSLCAVHPIRFEQITFSYIVKFISVTPLRSFYLTCRPLTFNL